MRNNIEPDFNDDGGSFLGDDDFIDSNGASSYSQPRHFEDDKEPSSANIALIIVLVGFGALAFVLMIAVTAYFALDEDFADTDSNENVAESYDSPPPKQSDFPQTLNTDYVRLARVKKAYNGELPKADEKTIEQVEQFMETLAKATQPDDESEFLSMISKGGFAKRVKASKYLARGTFLTTSVILEYEPFHCPIAIHNHKIAHIDRRPNTCEVFTYVWNSRKQMDRMSWVLENKAGQWQLVDWEYIDHGINLSTEDAVLLSYSGTAFDKGMQDFWEFRGSQWEGDREHALKQLGLAEHCKIPPFLKSASFVQLGDDYREYDEVDVTDMLFRQSLHQEVGLAKRRWNMTKKTMTPPKQQLTPT